MNVQWDIWKLCRIRAIIPWWDCPKSCSMLRASGYCPIKIRSFLSYCDNQNPPQLNSKVTHGASKAWLFLRTSGHAYHRCSKCIKGLNIFRPLLLFLYGLIVCLSFLRTSASTPSIAPWLWKMLNNYLFKGTQKWIIKFSKCWGWLSESFFAVPSHRTRLFWLLQDILIFNYLGLWQGHRWGEKFPNPRLTQHCCSYSNLLFAHELLPSKRSWRTNFHEEVYYLPQGVWDLPHVCFHPIIEHVFTFEHYSLQYNGFHVSGSRHTEKTLPGLGKDWMTIIKKIESHNKGFSGLFVCIYPDDVIICCESMSVGIWKQNFKRNSSSFCFCQVTGLGVSKPLLYTDFRNYAISN